MGHSALYDEDILLWSEQQADAIRRLSRTRRDLPNELDIENVAEEIESVGRSELAAVESLLQNILVHLVKLAAGPDAESARHEKVEVITFHGEVRRRYAPSMRQRVDQDQLWQLARELSILAAEAPEDLEATLPSRPPFDLDDFLSERINPSELAIRIQDGSKGAAKPSK